MKRIIVLIGMVFVFLACTGDFKEINTDKSGVTDEDLQADYNEHGIRLGIIQQGIYFNYDYGKGKNWPFQLTQNLNADMFSGYMHEASEWRFAQFGLQLAGWMEQRHVGTYL